MLNSILRYFYNFLDEAFLSFRVKNYKYILDEKKKNFSGL